MLPARGPMPKMFRDFGKPLFLDGSQVGELLETTPRRSRNQQPSRVRPSAHCACSEVKPSSAEGQASATGGASKIGIRTPVCIDWSLRRNSRTLDHENKGASRL